MEEVGGTSPHISKRAGAKQTPWATLAALPDEYRERLQEGTRKQAEARKRGRRS